MQAKIDSMSPFLALLDWLGKRTDEKFAEFSMNAARDAAWRTALKFAALPAADKPAEVENLDAIVADLAGLIRDPGLFLNVVIWIIRLPELKNPAEIIQRLF